MSALVDASDAEFIRAFEACEIKNQDFRHRDHVRLAWIYVQLFGAEEAERRARLAIQQFAVFNGASHKYDEALTLAWVRRVARAIEQAPAATFDELTAKSPSLLDKTTSSS